MLAASISVASFIELFDIESHHRGCTKLSEVLNDPTLLNNGWSTPYLFKCLSVP